jgi:hypothetical protein
MTSHPVRFFVSVVSVWVLVGWALVGAGLALRGTCDTVAFPTLPSQPHHHHCCRAGARCLSSLGCGSPHLPWPPLCPCPVRGFLFCISPPPPPRPPTPGQPCLASLTLPTPDCTFSLVVQNHEERAASAGASLPPDLADRWSVLSPHDPELRSMAPSPASASGAPPAVRILKSFTAGPVQMVVLVE